MKTLKPKGLAALGSLLLSLMVALPAHAAPRAIQDPNLEERLDPRSYYYAVGNLNDQTSNSTYYTKTYGWKMYNSFNTSYVPVLKYKSTLTNMYDQQPGGTLLRSKDQRKWTCILGHG